MCANIITTTSSWLSCMSPTAAHKTEHFFNIIVGKTHQLHNSEMRAYVLALLNLSIIVLVRICIYKWFDVSEKQIGQITKIACKSTKSTNMLQIVSQKAIFPFPHYMPWDHLEVS